MRMEKKILYILITVLLFMFAFTITSNAASVTFSASATSVTVGTKVTINLKGTAAAWDLYIEGDGIEQKALVGYSQSTENESFSDSVSFTPTKAGTYTINLTGKIVDETETEGNAVNKTVTITVKEKSTSSGSSSSGGNSSSGESSSSGGSSSGSTTTKTPTFTSANRTVYTTQTANLRSSWSTSSSATTVPAGTALTLTGTSSETINGYVWYRVTYNGATRYIANYLVSNTKPQETKETEKSDNNDLASLTIEGITLEPSFSKDVTEYTVQLAEEVTELTIDAQAESGEAEVEIDGNKDLQDGENTITITVTAEDGTTKEYTIKAIKGESANVVDNSVLKLSNLEISRVDFAGIFNPDTHSYELNLNISVKNLNITATPNQEDATVEIIGNENFVEGENMVTILVTSADGSQTATYQIKVIMPSEAIENKDNIQFYLICGGIVLATIIVIIIVVVIFRKRKNSATYEEEEIDNPYTSPLTQTNNEEENTKQTKKRQKEEIESQQEAEVEKTKKEKKPKKEATLDEFLDTSELDEKPKRPRGRHSR